MKNESNLKGRLKSLLAFLKKPTAKYSLGTLLIVGFVTGIIFWGGFNTAMEMTNTEDFCISCHEMRDYVYEEYKDSVHYSNRTGVRATCPDCHVPKEWTYKNIENMRGQLRSMGAMWDWRREAVSADPEYYKWNQWFFTQLYKNKMAYRKMSPVDFCPNCNTTLAREQVWGEDRHSHHAGHPA